MQKSGVFTIAILLCACGAAAPTSTPPQAPTALVRACAGTHLDLAWINTTSSCQKGGKSSDDSELVASLQPDTITVSSGGTADVALVLTNPTDETLLVNLGLYCDLSGVRWQINDVNGKRADLVSGCGGLGSGCGSPTTQLRLAPHGDARIYLPVIAIVKTQDGQCNTAGSQPMAPGSYIFEVEARAFSDKPLRAQLTVTEAQAQ